MHQVAAAPYGVVTVTENAPPVSPSPSSSMIQPCDGIAAPMMSSPPRVHAGDTGGGRRFTSLCASRVDFLLPRPPVGPAARPTGRRSGFSPARRTPPPGIDAAERRLLSPPPASRRTGADGRRPCRRRDIVVVVVPMALDGGGASTSGMPSSVVGLPSMPTEAAPSLVDRYSRRRQLGALRRQQRGSGMGDADMTGDGSASPPRRARAG